MNAWDQLPEESNAAYARFLAYRNLGPSRSLDRAYQATKGDSSLQAPGNWARESDQYQWTRRATAWDIAHLLPQGERTALLYIQALERYTTVLVEALEIVKPETFNDVTKALELMARLFPGDVLDRLIASYRDASTDDPASLPR